MSEGLGRSEVDILDNWTAYLPLFEECLAAARGPLPPTASGEQGVAAVYARAYSVTC